MKPSINLAFCLLLQGALGMATESIYPRTSPGACEIKEIPAATCLQAVGDKPYFGTENGLFMRLFSFIRDNRVAMTVPVEAEVEPGTMRFYLGREDRGRDLKGTPTVTVEAREARTVASCGVRGAYTPETYRRTLAALREWLGTQPQWEAAGDPYMVFWNSPFMPGFLKVSEVHIPLRRKDSGNAVPPAAPLTLYPLTPTERHVILEKGTEAPFSGRFWNYHAAGTYICRQCHAPLYVSTSKFDSDCGWPSFDEELPGAVRRQPDADGRRTEIVCARCGAHLGHVFEGEGYTVKDTRHCVNSLSLDFVPATPPATALRKAIFASGCFWGTQYVFQEAPGVVSTTVGYTGGTTRNPTYEQVCSHKTGHAEAVEVVYDPAKTTYEALCKLFFETHDPTQVDRQGPDVGTQYRSAIFTLDDGQKAIAEKLVKQLEAKGLQVATQIVPAGTFWPAEEYHQNYYQRTGKKPYCHIYTPRF
jgi:peptide methionine sulfoxide reductase msrA/msrB